MTKQRIKRLVSVITHFVESITDNHIFAYATQASFFVVISAVPFVMIILNVFQAVLPIEKGYLLQISEDFLPHQLENLAEKMINELYSNVSISLVSVTTIFLIWTASRGVKSISYGLKIVYKTNEKDNYFKTTAWSLVYTVLFMIGIVLSIIILIFGGALAEILINKFPNLSGIVNLIINLRYFAFIIYLTLVFMTAYKFLGKSKMKFRKQFIGALLAAVSWSLYTVLYSLYIENLSNFSVIYGSLAAVIFLMLWLWFCMIVLLFGAQINVWLNDKNVSIILFIKKQFK